MFKRKCKITFISHGATVHTMDGIINDNLKYPKLNDFGIQEMNEVCKYLQQRAVAYDRIYSSPTAYCTQSAQIVAKLFNKRVISLDLEGRKHGDWQNQSYADIYNTYGIEAFAKTPKNGESIKKFNKRVWKIINTLVEENKGNRIIIVTTPEIIQSALAQVLELLPENQSKILITTGSLTQISYFENCSSIIYSDYKPLQSH